MISHYFGATWALARMHSGSVGRYVDGFAAALAAAGYAARTIRVHIRAAVHFGRWVDDHGIAIAALGDDSLFRFRRHLRRCRCIKRNEGTFGGAVAGVKRLLVYLRVQQVTNQASSAAPARTFAAISERFAEWMLRHRGVTSGTVHRYKVVLQPFIAEVGEDPARYDVEGIRRFVIEHLGERGREQARSAVTAIRAFLRFLVAEGRVPSGIEHGVPAVPRWRVSSLPRYVEPPEVERVVNSCDLSKAQGRRDRAILLLLARLGLRAGDIVRMTVTDIDWARGTLRVHGKSRREALLPLPQDVGDAVLGYLEHGRPQSSSDQIFLTVKAPTRAFASSMAVSNIVRSALERAGIKDPPNHGAHLLRHSAATAMLRAGASFDVIATVLRHQSLETTAYYAKVDVRMLDQVAQPWPGAASC